MKQGEWTQHPVLKHHAPLVEAYQLPHDVIGSLVEGLMDDQAPQVLIKDEASLIQYAYKVAGTVGLLMCNILNNEDPRAKAHAVDLGIAMQLTNIAGTWSKMPRWGVGTSRRMGEPPLARGHRARFKTHRATKAPSSRWLLSAC